MTQPGVSQHLAKLEGEVGRALFERKGKRLAINDFGLLFLGKARELLAKADALKGIAKGVAMPAGNLRLGLTDAATETIIPPAIVEFRGKYPNVHIKLDVDDSKDIEEAVLRGNYDFGVVTGSLRPHPEFETEILYHDRIDAIVSLKHPLAKRRRLSLEELAKWPILVYPRRSRSRHIIDDAFHGAGIVPKEVIDVYINTAAVRLAEVGLGVALLPEAFITSEMLKHKCAHLRLEGDPFKRTICIVRKQGAPMNEAASCFYGMLVERAGRAAS
jgi:LysR family cys regulon transcriptional activator